jgi:GNAT superfamily N-acetyltransferase
MTASLKIGRLPDYGLPPDFYDPSRFGYDDGNEAMTPRGWRGDEMSEMIETDAPDAADIAVIADGLRAYNTAMAGYDDSRPLAVFVTDPATGKVVGGLYGASSRGQLRIDRFFLPEELRRDRLGSRLLKVAEAAGRRRGCTRVTLNTMEIQAPGFYLKQGYEMAAKLECDPPGVTRYVMTKRLL